MKKQSSTEVLTVRVSRVRSTSETFSVYQAEKEGELLGSMTVKQFTGPVRQMQRWCVAGSMVDDPRWGKQFSAQFATLARPTNDRQLEDFLCSGLVDGWGYHEYYSARQQCDGSLLQTIEQHPEQLADLGGITPEMIASLQAAWTRGSGLAPIYAQLADWGCNSRQSDALVKHYGFPTVEKLTENPYSDLLEINGYGWKTADAIAQALSFAVDDPRRIVAGLEVAVHEATWQGGSTWLDEGASVVAAMYLLHLSSPVVRAELDAAVADGRLVRDGDRIYPESLYRAEQTIAAQIAQRVALTEHDPDGPTDMSFEGCSQEQSIAVCMALDNPISLLTGGPGTGKTTTLKALIGEALAHQWSVTCMAPTGKAAARMAEATGHPASTIHSRLRLRPGDTRMPDDFEPLTGLVIVDEVSMLDTSLAATMLERISPAAQILLVGDPDQLPSVGPGAVLRDLISADTLPRVHLDHVYRNEAGIAVNAARMRAGDNILSLPDCQIISADSQDAALLWVLDQVDHALLAGKSRDQVLVLTPTNDGPVGRYALNQVLQTALAESPAGSGITQYVPSAKDPDGTVHKRSEELRPGDRVMVTRNSSELGVFNGQTGTVVEVHAPKSLDVDIDGATVNFEGENKRMLTLAYAITGHKSQGSEAPIVIAPIFPSRVLSREWLYTVMTRSKEACILIGDVPAIQGCISVQRCNERRTGLVEAIHATN